MRRSILAWLYSFTCHESLTPALFSSTPVTSTSAGVHHRSFFLYARYGRPDTDEFLGQLDLEVSAWSRDTSARRCLVLDHEARFTSKDMESSTGMRGKPLASHMVPGLQQVALIFHDSRAEMKFPRPASFSPGIRLVPRQAGPNRR